MTPVSLNPPGPSIQGQNQLFNSPNNQDYHASFFDILDRRQTIGTGELRENDHRDDKLVVWHDGSSSNNQLYSNSTFISQSQPVVMDNPSSSTTCDPNLPFSKMEEEDIKNVHGSAKWMSSKMRLMKKMMSPPATDDKANNNTSTIPCPRFQQNQGHENRYSQRSPRNNNNGSNNTTRVCSDCNTTSTPLWRSGPNGPKSLCNACGIRQRKARRAMAEAANGLATPINTSSTKTRVHHNKEKKPRTNHFAQFKNKSKCTSSNAGSSQEARKLECFKDFALSLRNNSAFMEVFPRDEVAEAALLLMDLSCGYVHS